MDVFGTPPPREKSWVKYQFKIQSPILSELNFNESDIEEQQKIILRVGRSVSGGKEHICTKERGSWQNGFLSVYL